MDWFNPLNSFIAIISSLVTLVATLVGVWITISKHRKEVNSERLELIKAVKDNHDTLMSLKEQLDLIKVQNDNQQNDIESTISFTKSYFRMSLYNNITKALSRGYTTIGEATEITKMYSIYRENGGNGEIELLFTKFDKLEIKEDNFYEVKQ